MWKNVKLNSSYKPRTVEGSQAAQEASEILSRHGLRLNLRSIENALQQAADRSDLYEQAILYAERDGSVHVAVDVSYQMRKQTWNDPAEYGTSDGTSSPISGVQLALLSVWCETEDDEMFETVARECGVTDSDPIWYAEDFISELVEEAGEAASRSMPAKYRSAPEPDPDRAYDEWRDRQAYGNEW